MGVFKEGLINLAERSNSLICFAAVPSLKLQHKRCLWRWRTGFYWVAQFNKAITRLARAYRTRTPEKIYLWKRKKPQLSLRLLLYPGRESNPHARRHRILNPARLPIPPPGQVRRGRHPRFGGDKDIHFLQMTRVVAKKSTKYLLFPIIKREIDALSKSFAYFCTP